jgi:hypothetical protein
MPRVQLDVRAAPSSDVAIDGRILTESEMSLPLFLDPGEHVLIVRGPGERRHLQAFSVLGAGPSARGFALQVVTVSPLGEASQRTAVPESYDTAPRHERDPWTPARRIGLGVAAGGVVAIGVGTYFGVRSLAALGDGVSDRTDARTSEVISMLALGAGAAALGVGTCLWLTPKAGLRGSARLVPSASSHGGGMGIAGTW